MDQFRDGFRAGYDAGRHLARQMTAAQMRSQAARLEGGDTTFAHEPGEPGHTAYVAALEDRAQNGPPVGGSFAKGGVVSSPVAVQDSAGVLLREAGPGFSLPQLYVVSNPNTGTIYGATRQQGLTHEEAATLAARLDAKHGGVALRCSILPLKPESDVA